MAFTKQELRQAYFRAKGIDHLPGPEKTAKLQEHKDRIAARIEERKTNLGTAGDKIREIAFRQLAKEAAVGAEEI